MFSKIAKPFYTFLTMVGITKSQDKILHVFAGFIITLVFAFAISPLAGFAIGASAGLAKEGYDQYKYSGADFFDFFATLLGSVLGLFLYGIIDAIMK